MHSLGNKVAFYCPTCKNKKHGIISAISEFGEVYVTCHDCKGTFNFKKSD